MKHLYATLLAALTLTGANAASLPSVPPVVVNFADWDADSFSAYFKTENLNNDEVTFTFGQGTFPKWPENRVQLRYPMQSDANDWLITATPVTLQAGKDYKVSVYVSNYASDKELVSVYLGTAPSASAMTITVAAPAKVGAGFDDPVEVGATVSVPATGQYYLGIHNSNAKMDGYWMAVHGFEISSDDTLSEPAKADAPEAVADKSGGRSVTIKANVPSLDVLGHELAAVTSLKVLRNGMAVDALAVANPAPGSVVTVTDNEPLMDGVNLYQVQAVSAEGEGAVSDVTGVYVGVNRPGVPVNALASRGSADGEVDLTWAAPQFDADFYPQNGTVTYAVYDISDGNETKVADNISGLAYTVKNAASDLQKLVSYRVYAVTSAGTSASGADTEAIPAGKAYTAPFAESFAGAKASVLWQYKGENEGAFDISGAEPQDADGGLLRYTGKSDAASAKALSGYIIAPKNGILSFYYKGDGSQVNLLIDRGQGFEQAASFAPHTSWALAGYDLAALEGKAFRFGFECNGAEPMLVDNISVDSRPAADLAITSLDAPESVKASTYFTVTVGAARRGLQASAGEKVQLFVGDRLAGEKDFDPAVDTYTFTVNVHVSAGEKVELVAVAVADNDAVEANNRSEAVTLQVVLPKLPAVDDLAVEPVNNGADAVLTWTRPSFEGIELEPVTEDFESYAPLSNEAGNWILTDVDGLARESVTYAGSHALAGITGEKGGFFVLDASGLNELLAPASGSKALCSVAPANGGSRDEWIISPELDGSEQTIRFLSKAPELQGDTYVLEYYESQGGTDPADFERIQWVYANGNRWNSLSFMVNEGSTRFAIRCIGSAYAEVLVDDITYRPSAAAQGLEFEGFNIYCDDVKLNDEVIADETFVHKNVPAGAHTYYVTCVTNSGVESPVSNHVAYGADGIGQIVSAAAAVRVDGNRIIVDAPASAHVGIASVDGRTVYSGRGAVGVDVAPGIYLVNVGSSVVKVAVR